MDSILRHSRKSYVGKHIRIFSVFLFMVTVYGCGDDSGSGSYYRMTNQKIETVSPWFVNSTYQVADRNGVPVTDVEESQVTVTEDGNDVDPAASEVKVYKRNSLPPGYNYVMRTVLLMDNSPSQHVYLEYTRQAVNAFIDNLNSDDLMQHEMAIIAYDADGEPFIVQEMTTDRAALKDAVNGLEATKAATDLYSAMLLGLSLWNEDASSSDAELVQGLLIAITDGNDTSGLHNIAEVTRARDAANPLCDQNKKIVMLAVGSNAADDNAFETLCNASMFDDNGYYVVRDPVGNSKTNFIREKLLDIQERVVACMDSFYWLEYRTDLTSNDAGAHALRIRINKNGNKDADGEIAGTFTTAGLFTGETDIYVKATNLNPAGEMELEPIYLSEGEFEVTRELTAVTYRAENAPIYTWTSSDDTVATIEVDPLNSSKATLTVVGPGDVIITVTDTANGITRDFVLHIDVIAKAEGYALTECNVESHAPWYVDAMLQANEKATGNFVSTLTRDDFICMEDGLVVDSQLQELSVRKHNAMPAPNLYKFKTVLLIDNSPSQADYIEEMKTAAKAFVDTAFPETEDLFAVKDKNGNWQQEIAILAYNPIGDMYIVQGFSKDPTTLKGAIDSIEESGGSTWFYAAVRDGLSLWDNDFSVNDGNNEFTQGIMVAMTDGYDSAEGYYQFLQMIEARDKDPDDPRDDKHVVVVGVSADLVSNVNMAELEQLDNFGAPGIYSVPDPGAMTLVGDTEVLLLEKTMVQVQQQLADFAKSFYWIEYRSNQRPVAPLDHELTVLVKNNVNTDEDRQIVAPFSAADFFDAVDNMIYINPSAANPGGIIDDFGYLDFTFLFDGWGMLQFKEEYLLNAVTFNAASLPQYTWTDPNPSLDLEYKLPSGSQIQLILPDAPVETEVPMTVTDTVNGPVQPFTVRIDDIGLAAPPVAYYPFNGSCLDETGNGYDGRTVGATLNADRYGTWNCAYSFDGVDDYISLDAYYGPTGIGQIAETIGDMTVCAWIKSPSSDKSQYIISFNYNYYWDLNITDGDIMLIANISDEVRGVQTSIKRYDDNLWHFVVATINAAGTMEIYVDGEADFEPAALQPLVAKSGTQYGYIGARRNDRGALDWHYKGLIDSVAIFGHVLTIDQIRALSQIR